MVVDDIDDDNASLDSSISNNSLQVNLPTDPTVRLWYLVLQRAVDDYLYFGVVHPKTVPLSGYLGAVQYLFRGDKEPGHLHQFSTHYALVGLDSILHIDRFRKRLRKKRTEIIQCHSQQAAFILAAIRKRSIKQGQSVPLPFVSDALLQMLMAETHRDYTAARARLPS